MSIQQIEFRQMTVENILATDMSLHFTFVDHLQSFSPLVGHAPSIFFDPCSFDFIEL